MMIGNNTGTNETWKRIPPFSVGAELGVWKGDSSGKLSTNASYIYLVDSWSVEPYTESHLEDNYEKYLEKYSKIVGSKDPKDFQKYYDNIYESVVERYKDNPKIIIKRMTTNKFFDTVTEKLDWVYVDADHSYEGCLNDLERSLEILKPGGIIFGDDYGPAKPGVQKAVDEFRKKHSKFLFYNFHEDQFGIKT